MDRPSLFTRYRRTVAAAVASLACVVVAPLAVAGTTPWSGAQTAIGTACQTTTTQSRAIFKAFDDTSLYQPAPSGTFESGTTGWTLTGAAGLASGNESFYVTTRKDKQSLSIPVAASATSPAICVGVEHPYSRLFARGPAGSTMTVELLFVGSDGTAYALPIARMTGSGTWAPSPKLYTGSFLLTKLSALSTTSTTATSSAVAYRFTTSGGSWQIDDLYVDPWKLR